MSASKKPILTLSLVATATITANLAVGYNGALASAGATLQGIADTDAAIGDVFAIDMMGTSIATAGAAIAVGAELEVGTGGKLITKNTGIGVARALQAASADGDVLEVFLLPK